VRFAESRRGRARPQPGRAAGRPQACARLPRRPQPDRGSGSRCPRPGSSSCCQEYAAEGAELPPGKTLGLCPLKHAGRWYHQTTIRRCRQSLLTSVVPCAISVVPYATDHNDQFPG
jgi:hypothetical protein